MNRNVFALSALCLALTFTSCKKDKDDDDNRPRTQIISDDDWVLQSASVDLDANGTGDFDVTSAFEDCERDNRYDFDDDGTGEVNEGPTKCDPSDPQQANFTWEFRNNETELFLSTPLLGATQTFKIISLSGSRMVLSANVNTGPGNQTVIGTFVR